jgi:hypothetical protein
MAGGQFWAGLRCAVVAPCIEPCGKKQPGAGLFEVQKLIAFKQQGMAKFPCLTSGCNQLQDIDCLLSNAPIAQPDPVEDLLRRFSDVIVELRGMRSQLSTGASPS